MTQQAVCGKTEGPVGLSPVEAFKNKMARQAAHKHQQKLVQRLMDRHNRLAVRCLMDRYREKVLGVPRLTEAGRRNWNNTVKELTEATRLGVSEEALSRTLYGPDMPQWHGSEAADEVDLEDMDMKDMEGAIASIADAKLKSHLEQLFEATFGQEVVEY